MRNRLMIGTAALLLASATLARGAAEQAAGSRPPTRLERDPSTSAGVSRPPTGDEARYERYRDLRNGANVNLLYNKETRELDLRREGAEHRLPRPAATR